MAVSEDQRHDLFEGFIDLLGRDRTRTLMELLPPVGWADVATKRDLDQQSVLLRHELKAEIGDLRTEMRDGFAAHDRELAAIRDEMRTGFAAVGLGFAGVESKFAEVESKFAEVDSRFADVRSEFADVRSEFAKVRSEFAEVRSEIAEVRAEIAEVRAEIAAVEARFERTLRVHLVGILSANAALAGLAFTFGRLVSG